MLKIRHYLNYKGHFYLCVQWKRMRFFGRLRTFLEVSGGFAELLRLIHLYPATKSGRSESGLFVIDNYF